MFTKLRRDKTNHFSVLDIETGKAGNVLEIGLYDGKHYNKFATWNKLLDFLRVNNHKKDCQKIIIHNGGRFDLVSLLTDSQADLGEYDIVSAGSTIIFLVCRSFLKNVIFQDSFQLLRAGLKRCCHDYNVETPKREIDINRIEEIFKNDYEQFDKYLQSDCISLFQVLKNFQKIMEIDFVPPTTASLAMYLFRRKFLKNDFMLPSLRMNDRSDRYISNAYAGGRVECIRSGIYDKVFSYDINSLYPSVMINNPFPVGKPKGTLKWNPKYIGFYEVTWKQPNQKIPPILWKKGSNGLEYVYEGSGTIPSPEIHLAIKYGVELKFKSGLYFPKSEKLFSAWVKHWYKERLTARKKGNNGLAGCCKLMLNSLYGKFAQKEECEKICRITNKETKIKLLKKHQLAPYQAENSLYLVSQKRIIAHRAVHIAAIVTSYARVVLTQSLIDNIDSVVYCDTDSVHLTKKMNKKSISDKLGAWKPEDWGRGVYLGRKSYMIGDKQKFKGISLKGSLKHDSLSFEDYCNLYNGKTIEFHFSVFPTIRSCWKRKLTACKETDTFKRIKKPTYTTNFVDKG